MTSSSAAARVQANLQELFKGKLSPGGVYIKFQLTSEITALLSMEKVQESLIVEAEKITILPSMPESVIGIMNSRDRVFCVFDLAQLLGLSSELIAPRQHQIIVLQTTSEQPIYIGFAVTQLQGIVRLPTEQIQSSVDGIAAKLLPYISGTVQQNNTKTSILNLDKILHNIGTLS